MSPATRRSASARWRRWRDLVRPAGRVDDRRRRRRRRRSRRSGSSADGSPPGSAAIDEHAPRPVVEPGIAIAISGRPPMPTGRRSTSSAEAASSRLVDEPSSPGRRPLPASRVERVADRAEVRGRSTSRVEPRPAAARDEPLAAELVDRDGPERAALADRGGRLGGPRRRSRVGGDPGQLDEQARSASGGRRRPARARRGRRERRRGRSRWRARRVRRAAAARAAAGRGRAVTFRDRWRPPAGALGRGEEPLQVAEPVAAVAARVDPVVAKAAGVAPCPDRVRVDAEQAGGLRDREGGIDRTGRESALGNGRSWRKCQVDGRSLPISQFLPIGRKSLGLCPSCDAAVAWTAPRRSPGQRLRRAVALRRSSAERSSVRRTSGRRHDDREDRDDRHREDREPGLADEARPLAVAPGVAADAPATATRRERPARSPRPTIAIASPIAPTPAQASPATIRAAPATRHAATNRGRSRRRRGSASPRRSRGWSGSAAGRGRRSSVTAPRLAARRRHADDDRVLDRRDLLDQRPDRRRRRSRSAGARSPRSPARPLDSRGTTTRPASSAAPSTPIASRPSWISNGTARASPRTAPAATGPGLEAASGGARAAGGRRPRTRPRRRSGRRPGRSGAGRSRRAAAPRATRDRRRRREQPSDAVARPERAQRDEAAATSATRPAAHEEEGSHGPRKPRPRRRPRDPMRPGERRRAGGVAPWHASADAGHGKGPEGTYSRRGR